jgi:hypothetical protein
MLSRVARSWIKTGDEFLTLWARIEKFFEKRKHLKKPKRETQLDDNMVISVDEARELCFELGEKLGFDALSCETTIAIIGNPLSTLKYLVAAGAEGRKLAELQKAGLLELPEPSGSLGPIGPSRASGTRRKNVIVQTKKSRGKK